MRNIVATQYGFVEGTLDEGQHVFRGVPYAAAPVGDLRWRAPQPPVSWKDIRPTKTFGEIAPQNPMLGMEALLDFAVREPQDEDCLYLNIWTPGTDGARRPVMVWIHGGAFLTGSGSQEMFRKNTLVDRGDVVLVTVNYRLGALGFMNLREITGGKIPATGCEGLLDQIAALSWVGDNIEAFGGDPGNITLFGESSGAMSIGTLMGMPAAEGKFHKAILQSGGGGTVGLLEESVSTTRRFLDILGLKSEDTDALRSLPVGRILSAQQKLNAYLKEEDHRITPFQPVVDGEILPEIPLLSVQRGSARGIPTLAGTNLDEYKLFNAIDGSLRNPDDRAMVRRLKAIIPEARLPGLIEVYRRGRSRRGEDAGAGDVLSAIQTDYMFRIPALRLVEAQHRNRQPAYNYLFTWKSPALKGKFGACHTLEIGFVFGPRDERFCGAGPQADALSRKMQEAWTAFARTGNPGCESLGAWEPYGDGKNVMVLGPECRIEAAPYEEERRAWDSIDMSLIKPI